MRTKGPYFVLYDGDCRVCTAGARFLAFIDVHRGIRVRPIQDSRDLLRSIPEDAVLDAAHAVSPDGCVTTGADAMPTLVGALVGTPNVERWLRSSRSSMRGLSLLYETLVALRGRLTCRISAPVSAARSPR
jgi:predicted DCC family thiol-disulfide oxidoreductase YuxK